jgi:hypothetical protein
VDGDKLSVEVVGSEGSYRPYKGRARLDLQ